MFRFAPIAAAVLGATGVLLAPAPASAQIMGGFRMGFPGGLTPLPSLPSLPSLPTLPMLPVMPPGFIPTPFYGRTERYGITAPGGLTVGYSRSYMAYGTGPWVPYFAAYPLTSPAYGASGSGGSGDYGGAAEQMRRDFAKAQRAATALSGAPPARNQVFDQWAYERLGVPGGLGELSGNPNPPEALQQALAATTEAEVASGEALNHILTAIVAAEPKTGKAPPSAFLPPNLMSEVRFGGSPAGEALNLLRSAGKLEFPAAFDVPALRDTRDVIDRDFAAAAAPVLAGKPADPLKTAKLAATVQAAKQRLTPVLRDQPFHEAAYARRFISQLEAAVKALREAGSSALVNPKWGTEGTNVADLVKHMTKHKLLFGPVEKGKEDAYLALHRALATYLFALTQAQQAKK